MYESNSSKAHSNECWTTIKQTENTGSYSLQICGYSYKSTLQAVCVSQNVFLVHCSLNSSALLVHTKEQLPPKSSHSVTLQNTSSDRGGDFSCAHILSLTLHPVVPCSLFSLPWMTLTDRLVATGTAPCLLGCSEAGRCEIHNMMAWIGSKPESISKPQKIAISSNHKNCRGDYLHFNRI